MKEYQIKELDELPEEIEDLVHLGHVKDEAEVYVDDIWLKPEYRRKNYGRILLEELEVRFKGKGYNNINLVTNGLQTVAFYKKCGYEVEFTRINKNNPKLNKTFSIKYFNDTNQHQGLLESKSHD